MNKWNYAWLSELAKKNGGPEKLVEKLVSSGKYKMLPLVGIALLVGSLATIGIQELISFLKKKKEMSDEEFEQAKRELIQGIKDYDESHNNLDEDEYNEDKKDSDD